MAVMMAAVALPAVGSAGSNLERMLQSGGDLSVSGPRFGDLLATTSLLAPAIATEVLVGRSFFRSPWVVAPASTTARDGLGPLFNARSCAACHPPGGRGDAPTEPGAVGAALVLRLSTPGHRPDGSPMPDPAYGDQLQTYASYQSTSGTAPSAPGAYPGEGRLTVAYRNRVGRYADGSVYRLRWPSYRMESLAQGPLHGEIRMSPRLAPALTGLGLLEAIPEGEILARADPQDRDGDGISGHANWVWDQELGRLRLGRFGHKATHPTLPQQVAAAFRDDLGLTSALYPDSSCTSAQHHCTAAPDGSDPRQGVEVTARVLDAVSTLVRAQGVQVVRRSTSLDLAEGRQAFDDFGCSSCHLSSQVTAATAAFPQLADQIIAPFTDLLLHDLGPALGDGRPEFGASGNEWRTAPLWGLASDRPPPAQRGYLHDGRARDLAEAVLWHGAEAESAREAFRGAPAPRRQALIQFLESL